MILLALLLSCETSPPWTAEAVGRDALAAVDPNGDGRLGADEYQGVAWQAPAFSEADTDGDGGLGPNELVALAMRQDPLDFDGQGKREAIDVDDWKKPFARPAAEQRVWELLLFMKEEVEAADPTAVLPSRDDIYAAAETQSLESDASRRTLVNLRAGYLQAGLKLPPFLEAPGE